MFGNGFTRSVWRIMHIGVGGAPVNRVESRALLASFAGLGEFVADWSDINPSSEYPQFLRRGIPFIITD